jgi:CRISPR-associated protein Cmr3
MLKWRHKMLIKITPIDSLLFRDGKPFTSGDSHNAFSIFPPKPSVFAGFIRSKILMENFDGDIEKTWKKLENEIGYKNEKYGKINIKAIFLNKDNEYYLQSPLDLVKEKRLEKNKEKEEKKIFILTPKKLNFDYKTDIGETLPFSPKEVKFAEQESGFISIKNLEKYLLGENDISLNHKSDFVESEPRVGIEIEKDRKTTKEGRLYSVEFLRFKENCGFSVLLDEINFGNKGIYFIGGEKRQVFCEKENLDNILSNNFLNNLKNKIKKDKKFKVLLITPSYNEISKGNIEPKELKNLLENIGVKFVSACIKTEDIGGFDIEKGHPKPIEKLISAGSVFYYELNNDNKINNLIDLNFKSISSKDDKLGYGKILIGGW